MLVMLLVILAAIWLILYIGAWFFIYWVNHFGLIFLLWAPIAFHCFVYAIEPAGDEIKNRVKKALCIAFLLLPYAVGAYLVSLYGSIAAIPFPVDWCFFRWLP